MNETRTPTVTIIVSARDRFSPTEACLDNLLEQTPQPHDLVVVLGGAPGELRRRLLEKFGARARFIFDDRFLNCAQARNIGLRTSKTSLTVCLDNDVYPRAGWLEPLLRCQSETGAGLVVPLMLEDARRIHTSGAFLFVTRKGGKSFGSKVLPFYKAEVFEGTTLERQRTGYGEMHCQLVDTRAALELGVLDERVKEGEELDSGLSWLKGGREIWVEPASVVVYDFPVEIEDPVDLPLFIWRWDIRSIIPGYLVMHEKWGMDLTEAGYFKYFLMRVNAIVGWLPRAWPTRTALRIDRALGRAAALLSLPGRLWSHLTAWRAGYYDWIEALEDPRPPRRRIVEELRRALAWPYAERRELVSVPVQDGVRIDACWRESNQGTGPSASLYTGDSEMLRCDCFGDGKGRTVEFPESRPRWASDGAYFTERTVAGQIERAVVDIRTRLDVLGLEPEHVSRACDVAARVLRDYVPLAGRGLANRGLEDAR
jgi:hypothetical protein